MEEKVAESRIHMFVSKGNVHWGALHWGVSHAH